MVLGQLVMMYNQGALNIKHEKGEKTAVMGGVKITEEQAKIIVNQLGWTEYYLHPFEIIDKTAKFIRGIKGVLTDDAMLNNTVIEFQNHRSKTYGKTFDRIHIINNGVFSVSVIYGMEGNSSPYVIYDSFTSVPLQRCRNLKKVAEYLVTLN